MRAVLSNALLCLVATACTSIEFADGGSTSVGGRGGAGASGGSGGGGASAGEICGNGHDDESDGLTDCDDPDCAPSCDVPEGWTGPVVLSEGCAGPEPLLGVFVSASGNPDCACGCTSGSTCGTPLLETFASTGCAGLNGEDELSSSACVPLPAGTDSVLLTSSAICGAASAALVDGALTVNAIDLCADDTGSCIFQAGLHTCPDPFPTAQLYSLTVNDARGCDPAACSCTPNCGAVSLFLKTACALQFQNIPIGVCHNLPPGTNLSVAKEDGPGGCLPDGEAPGTGTVSLSDPVTVCCR